MTHVQVPMKSMLRSRFASIEDGNEGVQDMLIERLAGKFVDDGELVLEIALAVCAQQPSAIDLSQYVNALVGKGTVAAKQVRQRLARVEAITHRNNADRAKCYRNE